MASGDEMAIDLASTLEVMASTLRLHKLDIHGAGITQTGRQTDRQTGRQTERQTDRQTDKQTDR